MYKVFVKYWNEMRKIILRIFIKTDTFGDIIHNKNNGEVGIVFDTWQSLYIRINMVSENPPLRQFH